MITNIIVWTFLLVSLLVILAIILRKFPLLASIDLEQIDSERQAELKQKILSDKFKRDFARIFNRVNALLAPVISGITNFARLLYDKLVNLQQSHTKVIAETKQDVYQQIDILLAEAEDLTRKDELVKAEHKYIEVIGLDGKNFKAYELLADNYASRDNNEEAEQTLLHTIKLKNQLMKTKSSNLSKLDLARNYYSLSLVYQKINETHKAIDYLQQSLALEPANPKYLDKIIELCIMTKDLSGATSFCQQLEASNPANKKLKEIKDQIKELSNLQADN
ncbi:MAG TPA: hypothetical protein PLJ58_03325 [bacterium]|nr:hypothetical protein [bacterium]